MPLDADDVFAVCRRAATRGRCTSRWATRPAGTAITVSWIEHRAVRPMPPAGWTSPPRAPRATPPTQLNLRAPATSTTARTLAGLDEHGTRYCYAVEVGDTDTVSTFWFTTSAGRRHRPTRHSGRLGWPDGGLRPNASCRRTTSTSSMPAGDVVLLWWATSPTLTPTSTSCTTTTSGTRT